MRTIKKNIATTVAHGFDIVDGVAVPVSYTVLGDYGSAVRVTAAVRKDHPNFMLDTFTKVKQTYEMPLDTFMAQAEIIDTLEA